MVREYFDLFVKNIIESQAYHYSQSVFQTGIQSLKETQNIQKTYSPLTNIIFWLLCFLFIYIAFSIIKGFFILISRTIRNFKNKKLMEKEAFAKEQVRLHLLPTVTNSKYKNILDFKNEKTEINNITSKIQKLHESDVDQSVLNSDRLSGKCFQSDNNLNFINSKAAEYFSFSNLLHPDVYSAPRHCESELIKICLTKFNGAGIDCCGSTTYSSTESNILALRAYKNCLSHINKPLLVISAAYGSEYEKYLSCLMLNLLP